ncbi:bile acid:sodium symporter family protein [Sphingomonas sp.]|jgi:sodium/bile acid cotransporter 7|uniref:bile acid:sodium symporter family protein n=1 Tax=Sphingomonas sp. TaxID=28214 RepID=UPI0035C79FF6
MLRRILAAFEPFVLLLLATVVIASLLPPRGVWVTGFDRAADAGIVLLFLLHGAKLSREAIIGGLRAWPLHLAVLAMTFGIFPLLGLAMIALPILPAALATGFLFLTLLPSTVQSSIAFTSIARGNVAAAVCSASFSNLAGMVVTPMLATLLIRGHGSGQAQVPMAQVEGILLQLLLPFVLGHLLRPWIGGWIGRRKALVTAVDRGSILLVVYTAFGAAVVGGLWRQVSGGDMAVLLAMCAALLTIVLLLTWYGAKAMRLDRANAIVLLFCGSKKSLASGVPIAGVLFPTAQVGMAILPLMLFHQIQLIACAVIARRLEEGRAD